jgi:hypothetical protein
MQTPKAATPLEIQIWPIDRLVLYARNPRKNDAVVDRMCSSIREFGFKIPVLARSDGEVVDGHLRIKAARKLRIDQIRVILCDEWSPAQAKAFRLMVNRSVSWASWDDELLALELQEQVRRRCFTRCRWIKREQLRAQLFHVGGIRPRYTLTRMKGEHA